MAIILEQSEIDALLDVVEVDEETGAENIGLEVLKGTTAEELQEVKIGAQGFVVRSPRGFTNEFTNEKAVEHVTVIALSKEKLITIIIDSKFNPTRVNVSELETTFYKSRDRYEALAVKSMFDMMEKKLNETMGIEFNDFVQTIKSSKHVYPEIWI